MFLGIALVLLLLWVLGAFIVPVGGALIHLLLIIALVSVIWHFVSRRSGSPRV
jgi:hypothetical protein